jgi:hypothetical protein
MSHLQPKLDLRPLLRTVHVFGSFALAMFGTRIGLFLALHWHKSHQRTPIHLLLSLDRAPICSLSSIQACSWAYTDPAVTLGPRKDRW